MKKELSSAGKPTQSIYSFSLKASSRPMRYILSNPKSTPCWITHVSAKENLRLIKVKYEQTAWLKGCSSMCRLNLSFSSRKEHLSIVSFLLGVLKLLPSAILATEAFTGSGSVHHQFLPNYQKQKTWRLLWKKSVLQWKPLLEGKMPPLFPVLQRGVPESFRIVHALGCTWSRLMASRRMAKKRSFLLVVRERVKLKSIFTVRFNIVCEDKVLRDLSLECLSWNRYAKQLTKTNRRRN